MRISVLIPTHNRPDLLLEAARSVANQTYDDWEVVIVDDGSDPPVAHDKILTILGDKCRFVRHQTPKGIAEAKNAGIRHAQGDVTLHLDDDDLLEPFALDKINFILEAHLELDCLFVNAKPFGRYKTGTQANQVAALEKFLSKASERTEGSVCFLGSEFLAAALNSVPWALQRPAARRRAWEIAGELRQDSYLPEPEWALWAALHLRAAVLTEAVYLARVDGQNMITSSSNVIRQLEAGIDTRKHLYRYVKNRRSQFGNMINICQKGLANAYFSKAYQCYWTGSRVNSWVALMNSFIVRPGWRQGKFLVRTFLPRIKK